MAEPELVWNIHVPTDNPGTDDCDVRGPKTPGGDEGIDVVPQQEAREAAGVALLLGHQNQVLREALEQIERIGRGSVGLADVSAIAREVLKRTG